MSAWIGATTTGAGSSPRGASTRRTVSRRSAKRSRAAPDSPGTASSAGNRRAAPPCSRIASTKSSPSSRCATTRTTIRPVRRASAAATSAVDAPTAPVATTRRRASMRSASPTRAGSPAMIWSRSPKAQAPRAGASPGTDKDPGRRATRLTPMVSVGRGPHPRGARARPGGVPDAEAESAKPRMGALRASCQRAGARAQGRMGDSNPRLRGLSLGVMGRGLRGSPVPFAGGGGACPVPSPR